MIKIIRKKWLLFLTALSQVTFVAMQPMFIIKHEVLAMLVTGFLISLIWTFNIKKVAFGDWIDRVTYATGAMIGTYIGYKISSFIIDKF